MIANGFRDFTSATSFAPHTDCCNQSSFKHDIKITLTTNSNKNTPIAKILDICLQSHYSYADMCLLTLPMTHKARTKYVSKTKQSSKHDSSLVTVQHVLRWGAFLSVKSAKKVTPQKTYWLTEADYVNYLPNTKDACKLQTH